MNSYIDNQSSEDFPSAGEPMLPAVTLSPARPRKEVTGNVLSLHDAEMQLINSGPLGMQRLALARAMDMKELMPTLSDRDAKMIGAGYVMLRLQGMGGALIETTRSEVARLEAAKRVSSDGS